MMRSKQSTMIFGIMVIVLQYSILSTQPLAAVRKLLVDTELCAYSEFCQHNISSNLEQSQTDNCICFEHCNSESVNNETLSQILSIHDTTRITCMSLTTVNLYHMNMRNIYLDNMYKVVDRCPSMTSCTVFNQSAHWGSMYPVYSPASDKIYLNELCAVCNQDFEVLKWDVEVNCEVPWLLNIFIIEGFKRALDGKQQDKDCFFRFLPPKMVNPFKSRCLRSPSIHCTSQSTFAIEMNRLCATSPLYGYDGDDDINCYPCSELPSTVSSKTCDIKGTPRTTGISLSFLLQPENIVTFSKVQGTRQSEYSKCNVNEVAEAKTGVCRQVRCPEGMIQTWPECAYISSEWMAGPFFLFLRLEPRTEKDKLDREELNKLYAYKGKFFKHNLQSWKQNLYFYLFRNVTIVRYFVLKLWHSKHTFSPHDFFEEIRLSLKKPWTLSIGEKVYEFNAFIHKYAVYQFCNRSVENILKSGSNLMPQTQNPLYTCESQEDIEFLTTIRDEIDTHYTSEIAVTIFFLCKQVDLKPSEYVMYKNNSGMIYVNITGQILEEAEFRWQLNQDGTFRISVCMSAFGDDFWELPSTGSYVFKLHNTLNLLAGLLYLAHGNLIDN